MTRAQTLGHRQEVLAGNFGPPVHLPANPAIIAPVASMHASLRLATSLDHQRVDQAISRFDLACAQGYAAFLDLNATALASLRPSWREVDTAEFDGLLEALAMDLGAFGATPSPGAAMQPASPIDGLGLAYVVRGARLGARILRQRVPTGFPAAYLDFAPALSWPRFLRQLNDPAEGSPGRAAAIVQGARAAFAVYGRLAHLGGVPA
jgi:heme oxygenase (biliverdin-IX-beta and delta-forming)